MNQDLNIITRERVTTKRRSLAMQAFVGVVAFFCMNTLLAQNSIQIGLSFVVNESASGEIDAEIINTVRGQETSTEVKVSKARLRELVQQIANEEQFISWLGPDYMSASDDELISLYELRARGLEIKFNPSLLEISALVPITGIQDFSLRGRRNPVPEDHYAQAKLASGLNVFVDNSFNHEGSDANPSGFGDTSVALSGFTTIGGFGGWSLFYEGNYLENDEVEFARQDVTLIHDSFKHGLRYAFGDFRPSTSDFQNSPDVLGISVERDYQEINPFRNINPSGRSNFTLDRAALVSFEVNGEIVDTQKLQPGRYSIKDFPLAVGANDIRVFVDDGTSNVEIANFSSFVDIDLLEQGITNFGASAGVLRDIDSGRRRRYGSDPALFAFYEKGVTQKLTLGAQLEYSENHALLASKAIYGTRVGLLALEAAVSDRDEIGTGYSTILRFDHDYLSKAGWVIENDFQARYQSEDFVDITQDLASSETWGIDLRSSFNRGNIGLTLTGSISTANDIETRSFSTSLRRAFSGYDFALRYRYSESDIEGSESDIGITVARRFGGARLQTGVRTNTVTGNDLSVDWDSAIAQRAGGIETRIRLEREDLLQAAQLELDYNNARYEVDVTHRTQQGRLEDDGIDIGFTDITFSSAFGFADGKFAFGRPFTDGFAIANTHKNLRGKKTSIINAGNEDGAITGLKNLGTTLIPIDTSYREQIFQYDIDDLPFGYDIGDGEVRLFPGFLAGYRFQIGSDAANTVIGNVTWPDNTPLSLKSGKLIPQSGGDSIVVFTNRTGRFVAEKARFGIYEMVFTRDGERFSTTITIEESDEPGLVQVGAVTLEKNK